MEYEIEDENVQNKVSDASDRKYFTIIPNYIFELELSPHAVRLYCELKRVAGEGGRCWMSTRVLSDKTGMSVGAISECKKQLEEKQLIKVNKVMSEKGICHSIEIINIWERNINYFSMGCSPSEQLQIDHPDIGAVQLVNGERSPRELERSLGETNKNLINKNKSALTKESYKERIAESMRKFEEKRLSGQTDFAWLDEGLVHFARAFIHAWNPDYQPMGREYSLWKSELWEWQRLGLTDDIIERTVTKMRKENLTIKSPKSITGIALDMKAKAAQGQDDLPPVFHVDLGGLSEQEWYKQNYHK